MSFFFSSLGLAMYYATSAFIVYGDSVFHYEWIPFVFWWIIGTGALLSGIDVGQCGVCRLLRRRSRPRCEALRCTHA